MDVWSSTANMTTERYFFDLVVLGDFIYAIGGEGASATAERYNPSTRVWELLPGRLTIGVARAVTLPIDSAQYLDFEVYLVK